MSDNFSFVALLETRKRKPPETRVKQEPEQNTFSYVSLLDPSERYPKKHRVLTEPEHYEIVYFIDRVSTDFRPIRSDQVKQEPDETFYWSESQGNPDFDYYRPLGRTREQAVRDHYRPPTDKYYHPISRVVREKPHTVPLLREYSDLYEPTFEADPVISAVNVRVTQDSIEFEPIPESVESNKF